MTATRFVVALLVVGIGVGLFFAGRASAPESRAKAPGRTFADGYRAGREDAFGSYDGGWAYGMPYIVVLRRGGPGITYRIAQRWPMLPHTEYRACRSRVCTRAAAR